MSDGYSFRSTGITRKVLIALHDAPTGCYIMVGTLIGVLTAPLTLWLLRRVLDCFGVELGD
jgi:hypothetical protein